MSASRIEVIIDEIIVHGVLGLGRDAFAAGVERELTRLLREGGLPGLSEFSGRSASAPVRTVMLAPGEVPGAAQVACAVHGALKG